MSDNLSSSDSTINPVEMPGAILKAARQKTGLSTGDIAKELNLSVAKLEALETDQYDKLPSAVFVQGYLRRYGKLLNLDGDRLVAQYNAYRTRMRQTEQETDSQQESSEAVAPPRWVLPLGIFLLAIIVLAFVFIGNRGSDGESAERSVPSSRAEGSADNSIVDEVDQNVSEEMDPHDTVEAGVDAVIAEPDNADNSVETRPGIATPQSAPQNLPRQAQTDTPPAADASPAQSLAIDPGPQSSERGVLTFFFTEDCWVEVTNGAGTIIHAALENAGESLTVESEGPFSIMLGNARGVSLSYNGETVPVNPRPGSRTFRLEVGMTGNREQVTGNR
ncbi:MAG: RodZ domain-containing protein [Cellvibrionaceae bacterium]